jgi:hypothetical protein
MWQELQNEAASKTTDETAKLLRDYFWLNRGPWSMYVMVKTLTDRFWAHFLLNDDFGASPQNFHSLPSSSCGVILWPSEFFLMRISLFRLISFL